MIICHIVGITNLLKNDFINKTQSMKYNIIDLIHFPDISRFDPVARAIGLRPGQVCHIVRPSKTAITADYYRICV